MKQYYIICLEERSMEGTFLFWKPESRGYTSDFGKAGLFSEKVAKDMNKTGRDIALTKEELMALNGTIMYTVVTGSLGYLQLMKKEKK